MLRRLVPSLTIALLLSASLVISVSPPAFACGDETGSSCDTGEDDARYMLKAAVVAVQNDEASALTWFTEQSHGFRTQDLYVYCIGPDHIMARTPTPRSTTPTSPQTLIDKTGYHFAEVMLKPRPRRGRSPTSPIMWPRLDALRAPSIKHTMYTKVKDQICAVGYYE